MTPASPLHLRLPATSANLGSGFDTAGIALSLFLEIEAAPAERFLIEAAGRNADACAAVENNLILDTYRDILQVEGKPCTPLALRLHNAIPLGMGCGSSAAARLAGVALASHFGGLGWKDAAIVREAARREGHPDNIAACWYGGFTLCAEEGGELRTVTFAPPAAWRALLALPEKPVATSKARAVLPQQYSREDAVRNVQSVAMLVAAFAAGRADLLRPGTRDRLHQPYRGEICPLLPLLLPLAGSGGIASVTLSGAGPSVLLLLEAGAAASSAKDSILSLARHAGIASMELIEASLEAPKHGRILDK